MLTDSPAVDLPPVPEVSPRAVAWRPDTTNRAEHLVQQELVKLSAEIRRRADACPDQKERKRLHRLAVHLQSRSAVVRALASLKSHPAIARKPSDFDRDPDLFNTASGVVHLPTGRVYPHEAMKDRLISKGVDMPLDYGEPTRWLDFLSETFENNGDVIAWIQQWLGYCASGRNNEKMFVACVGTRDSGKSVFGKIVRTVFGDYHADIGPGELLASSGSRHPAGLASFVTARLATSNEVPPAGAKWRAAEIKQITGGDPITVRLLYQNPRTVEPRCKIMTFSNHAPSSNGDRAMLRRLVLVPFRHRVPPAKQYKHLADDMLRAEGGRILNWIVEGARLSYAHGLGDLPGMIQSATEEYQNTEDVMSRFVMEACEQHSTYEVTSSALYAAWQSWCLQNGISKEDVGDQRSFTRVFKQEAVPDFGLTYSKHIPDPATGRAQRGFKGIQLRQIEFEAESQDPVIRESNRIYGRTKPE